MAQIYDLSLTLRPASMESRALTLDLTPHDEAARAFAKQHGVRVSALPGASFFTTERVGLGSHAGTHLDAPYHFYPTAEGAAAKFIDEVPLKWGFADAVVLDFRHKKPTDYITEHDIAAEMERLRRTPRPGDIVINWTGGTDGYDDDPHFVDAAAGMDSGALQCLFRHGVTVLGVDSATIDMPIRLMTERFMKGDQTAYFPIHRAGRLKEWTHAEKLANLKSLPGPSGFKVMFLPIKITRGTGAWIRAVAIADEWLQSRTVDLVDLSLPIMNASFEPVESRVVTSHHAESRRAKAKRLGVRVEDIPHMSSMDQVTTYTQAGTHVCAPYHFGPTVGARRAPTVDELPLEWFYDDAVLLDFSQRRRPNGPISQADLRGELDRLGCRLRKGMIVLIRSGAADAFFDDPNFVNLSPSLAPAAMIWLLEQGVRVVGCDAESLDGPVDAMVTALRDGRSEDFFPIHYLCRGREVALIQKMDLSGLRRSQGFKVAAFPVKLEACGSAWTRAVALVDRDVVDSARAE